MAKESPPERIRRASRPHAAQNRTPQPGTRFPSQVLGDNVRRMRESHRLRQRDLAERVAFMGFPGWSQVTISDIERGIRSTGVDELFALAAALETTVCYLLDPGATDPAANDGSGIDLGVRFKGLESDGEYQPANLHQARKLLVTEDAPWQQLPNVGFRWRENRIVGFYGAEYPWMVRRRLIEGGMPEDQAEERAEKHAAKLAEYREALRQYHTREGGPDEG